MISSEMTALPSEAGSYALVLRLTRPHSLQIGALGLVFFPPGQYVYLGSARGPGGLRARLGRHLLGTGKRHWHIDALRAVAQVEYACYLKAIQPLPAENLECCWSQALQTQAGAWLPAPGLGASDCRAGCRAHLVGLVPRLPGGALLEFLARRTGVARDSLGLCGKMEPARLDPNNAC